jgi:hypothetical protein
MGDQSELVVYVRTDFNPQENEWVLWKQDGPDWIEVASETFDESRTEYEDVLCLEPDSTYRWTYTDTMGNGMDVYGVFSLTVNGEEIFASLFWECCWSEKSIVFATPSDPTTGSVQIITGAPSSSPSGTPTESTSPSSNPSSPFPSSSPSSFPTVYCDGDDDRLIINVFTDILWYENYWTVEQKDETLQSWFEIARNDLPLPYTTYVDNLCLEPGLSYRWTLFDSFGDGMDMCEGGSYSVKLNGEEIVSDGRFFDQVVKEIGPVECVDERGFHRFDDPRGEGYRFRRATCTGVARQIRLNEALAESICAGPLLDGSGQISDKCKATCGSYGAGPCAR